jgi:cytochrome c-type biogenesis protein CcmE
MNNSMNFKLFTAVFIVVGVLGVLIWSASSSTAKRVVTVAEILERGTLVDAVQLGARVVEGSRIEFLTEPENTVRFDVTDITDPGPSIKVVYHGMMPDTLKPGRDVILQGTYNGGNFEANSLLTQCPSKYEPPKPGAQTNG